MILRVNAVYAIIVFFFFLLQIFLPETLGTLCLQFCWLVKNWVTFTFISPEDLKICQNLMTLTRMQAESQRKHICKSQNFKNESQFGQEVIKQLGKLLPVALSQKRGSAYIISHVSLTTTLIVILLNASSKCD